MDFYTTQGRLCTRRSKMEESTTAVKYPENDLGGTIPFRDEIIEPITVDNIKINNNIELGRLNTPPNHTNAIRSIAIIITLLLLAVLSMPPLMKRVVIGQASSLSVHPKMIRINVDEGDIIKVKKVWRWNDEKKNN